MSEHPRPLAVVSPEVSPSAVPDSDAILQQMETQHFAPCCSPQDYRKLKKGLFLVDLDKCYAGIAALTDFCNRHSNLSARILIAEIAPTPLVLSPLYQGIEGFLQEKGYLARWTGRRAAPTP